MWLFLTKASVKPELAVLVGDSITDAETTRRSGVDFVAVLTGTTTADQFPDFAPKAVLESVIDIEKFAEQWFAPER